MTIVSTNPQIVSATAASLSAIITILLFVYATRNLHFTKRLEKVRLTLAELHREDLKKARDALHDFLMRHAYNLQSARDEADVQWEHWYVCEPDCAIKDVFDATFHAFTSLSTLYARGFLDKRTILDRYALLFARYYFVFYTYLETLQIQGDQTYTALVLGRDSLAAVRRRSGELFVENPELRTFEIPARVTKEIANQSTVTAMDRLRALRRATMNAHISTADTSTVAS
ncbi:MAG TPA: hypothetical protein VN224_10665 [Xanthomonadales bacterium]|nr:hypothetical protein [Xanthomonadales bacterium]